MSFIILAAPEYPSSQYKASEGLVVQLKEMNAFTAYMPLLVRGAKTHKSFVDKFTASILTAGPAICMQGEARKEREADLTQIPLFAQFMLHADGVRMLAMNLSTIPPCVLAPFTSRGR